MNGGDQPDDSRRLKTARPRAFVYLRTWQRGPECYAYCEQRGYRTSVVYDPDGTRYDEMLAAMVHGEGEVIVVWSRDDLPPERVPRIEEVRVAPPDIPRQRRPRIVRPPE